MKPIFLDNAGELLRTSPLARRAASPLLRARSSLMALERKLRLETWSLTGAGGGPKVLFAGGRKSKNYLLSTALGESASGTGLGRHWAWRLPRLFETLYETHAVLIIECDGWLARRLKKKGDFFLPAWVGGSVDIRDPERHKTRSKKNDLRKIRKYGLSYEVKTGPEWFDYFYRQMYEPFVARSHGLSAMPTKREEMARRLSDCEMLFVRMGGEYIAGNLIYFDKGTPRLWALGVKDGADEYLAAGATGAVSHFDEVYLRAKGYQSMHYGASRPFLRDGVLQFKKCREIMLSDFTERGFLMRLSKDAPGLEAFLLDNPFIFLEDGALNGAVFARAEGFGPESVPGICTDYLVGGLARLDLFLIDAIDAPESGMDKFNLPAGFEEKLRLRELN